MVLACGGVGVVVAADVGVVGGVRDCDVVVVGAGVGVLMVVVLVLLLLWFCC